MRLKIIFGLLTATLLTIYMLGSQGIDNDTLHEAEKVEMSYTAKSSSDQISKDNQKGRLKKTELEYSAGKVDFLVQNDAVHKSNTIAYEDEWCIASEDLSDDDQRIYNQDSKEWLLERGIAFIRKDDYNEYFNNDLVESNRAAYFEL